MKMKNPDREVWDAYWLGIYNKIERGIAWIIISIGAIIILGYSAITAIEQLIVDSSISPLMKTGIFLLLTGFVILFVSLIREKFFKMKHDKYKEIER